MGQYRKIPVVIEAVQWTGANREEMDAFAGGSVSFAEDSVLSIFDPEHPSTAEAGEWVIKGVEGEFYACPESVFAKTYEDA